MTARCLICCTQISSAASRRNLNGESSREVKLIIEELLCRTERADYVDEYMKQSSIVCRKKCFSSFEKFVKLKKECKQLDSELSRVLQQSFYDFLPSGNKRVQRNDDSDSETTTSHTKRRREGANTPTKQFLSQPIIGNSPVVAVCTFNCVFHAY